MSNRLPTAHEEGVRAFPRSLVGELSCPYCGGAFEVTATGREGPAGLEDGVLRCACFEYPVVRGIAVLRQVSDVSSARNEAVERLKRGDADGALRWLLETGGATGVPSLASLAGHRSGWRGYADRLRAAVRGEAGPPEPTRAPLGDDFEAALRRARPPGYADYLFHRFANPSLLGAIPPLLALGARCARASRPRVLDLMCGLGHTSAILARLYPELDVLVADSDFVNLFFARSFTATGQTALCIDAEVPLPFADDSVGGVVCLDGLHYVRSKTAFLEQVDRVVADDGAWLFAHMHNARRPNDNPGTPLTPGGYAERFTFGEHRLLAESAVLQGFRADGALDLREQPPLASLDAEGALTLLGSRGPSLWRRHGGLDDVLGAREGLLGLNPLYAVERAGEETILTARWPSEALRAECTRGGPVLPSSLRVPTSLLEGLGAAPEGGAPSDGVRELIRSFVLVPLPACYPGPRAAGRAT